MPCFETLVLIALVLALLKYHLRQRWSVLKDWNIPHDPPSVLNFGHAKRMFTSVSPNYEMECREKYGPVWGLYIVTIPRIVIHDPEMLRQIMVREFSTFPNRFDQPFGLQDAEMSTGLVLARGEQWRRCRATIAPSFSPAKLRHMGRIVNWCVGNTLRAFSVKVQCKDGIFVANDMFSRLSLDVICSAAFSTDTNSQDDTIVEPAISNHAKEFFKSRRFGILRALTVALPFLGPMLARLYDQKHRTYFRRLCHKMMQARKAEGDTSNRVDLLQSMINAKVPKVELNRHSKKSMTSKEVYGNAVTMLLTGYDTTGTAMAFLAYNLAVHQDVQRHLQVEIDKLFEKNETLEYSDVVELKYLDMCVNESLRLYCPVPRTVRTAQKEIVINGLTIPKGSILMVPIYALCHDPEYWESPMEFRPERMRDMSEVDPMIFQPFGCGPRNCVGLKFAFMEMKLAFCSVLRNFCLETTKNTPKPPLEMCFPQATARSKCDFELRVVPRPSIIPNSTSDSAEIL